MLSVGFRTDTGRLRSANEDSIFVLPDQNLYIVADGVGGHNSGEIASRMAVGFIAQYVNLNPLSQITDNAVLRDYFKTCFDAINKLIYDTARSKSEHSGMATTTVLCCVKDNWAYIVNVGDSRAYLIREGVLRQLTVDHTYVNTLINSGLLSEQEAAKHPDRNMITKALGADPFVEPDYYRFELCSEDIIILCSDGLYGELPPGALEALSACSYNMHDLASRLVDEANKNGGKDNISVICVRVL